MITQPVEKKVHAPCSVACPVHTDTRQFVAHITEGEYERALDLLLDANPFSSVCGRICHHPCEQSCRRSKVDAPIGLMQLKRFVVEATRDYRTSRRAKTPLTGNEIGKVAVVGSGPSGMTAAYDLVKKGYSVVVFERMKTPGGLLGNALPRYRLPYSAVSEDIEDILSHGVELRTDQEIGQSHTIDDLFTEGYKAVLLATGLSESRTLNIAGIDSSGVLLALPFLRTVRSPIPPVLGNRVVVIGGGNVAIDVARSSRRLGAERVTMVCLESRDEMPAWQWEIEEALEEGINIMSSWGPKAVFSEGERVKGLELRRCTQVFDAEKRFDPRFDESDNATLLADNVIIAVGQRADLTSVRGSDLRIGSGERLEVDPETLSTSREGVFACGELLVGPASAVEAVRTGHSAASSIDHYLRTGTLLKQSIVELPALGELPDDTVIKLKKRAPVRVQPSEPKERVKAFVEIDRSLSEQEARAEAKRCITCATGAFADEDKCAACLTCVRICPFGVATVEKTAVMPEEKCQACGLCAAHCPAAAIALTRFGTDKIRMQLRDCFDLLKAKRVARPLVISYCCVFETTSRKFIKESSERYRDYGIYRTMVPCVARLSVHDILLPFEHGADGVSIIACSEGSCLYPTAEDKLLGRIREAKRILEEIGLEGERIDFWKTVGSAEVSWTSFWEISRRKLNRIVSGTEVEPQRVK